MAMSHEGSGALVMGRKQLEEAQGCKGTTELPHATKRDLMGAGHSKHEDCVVRSEPGTIGMKHPAALHGGYPTMDFNILVSM